ncbi:MAG TPA: hypothetical protein VHR18_04215 [Solirubrobacterales bacterium]|nr:hypothetical protein [Solirubrobacterales bacterium]
MKKATKSAKAAGKLKLAVKPTTKTAKILTEAGKAKVTVKVTFTPSGGEPRTRTQAGDAEAGELVGRPR